MVIPPAFGLADVKHATYTGDGDISYWNTYVAVTQMGGQGAFKEPRLGIDVKRRARTWSSRSCAALKEYQHSIADARAPGGELRRRGGQARQRRLHRRGRCATATRARRSPTTSCTPRQETGMDPAYATRSATKKYRTTPLRGLWQHPPYFHDGSATSLARWSTTTRRPSS